MGVWTNQLFRRKSWHARLYQSARARGCSQRRHRQYDLAGLHRHQDGYGIPKDVLESKIPPQIPIGRLGKPAEIAGLITYLCSDEAAFITGANIAINGGQHMQ